MIPRNALIVGVDVYKPNSNLENLTGAVNDAKSIQKLFSAISYKAVGLNDKESDNNFLPIKKNIIREFDDMCKNSTSNSLVLFYFAGHGSRKTVQKPNGEYLSDHPVLLSGDYNGDTKSAIAMFELEDIIKKFTSQKQNYDI